VRIQTIFIKTENAICISVANTTLKRNSTSYLNTSMISRSLEGNASTLIIASIVLVFVYIFFSPRKERHQERRQPNVPVQLPRRNDTDQRPIETSSQRRRAGGGTNSTEDEEGIQSFIRKHIRYPPHHSGQPHASLSLNHEGILPFKLTKAYYTDSKALSDDIILQNKRDRARVLAKIFKVNPPSKGSVVVVSVSSSLCSNKNMHRSLFLLGTYYNIFVIVEMDNEEALDDYKTDKGRTDKLIADFYSDKLSSDVLPHHRIVPTTSMESRIAFVRQLPRCDYVIGNKDDDVLMQQLTKFGYKVILSKIESILG
jgi:hypothetical protein